MLNFAISTICSVSEMKDLPPVASFRQNCFFLEVAEFGLSFVFADSSGTY
jgi:hypothetical protein